jgi:hypothetical protein
MGRGCLLFCGGGEGSASLDVLVLGLGTREEVVGGDKGSAVR